MLDLMKGPAAPLILLGLYLVASALTRGAWVVLSGRYRDSEMSSRGASALLPMAVRMGFSWTIQPLLSLAKWTGIPATGITTLATLLALGSGVALSVQHFALGGWLYIFAGICDILDGRIARSSGTSGPSGAAIDSILDRYADSAVLAGLAIAFRDSWPMVAALAALVGTTMVSYIRARGEGLGVDVNVGLMQRPERIALLGATLALAPVIQLATGGAVQAVWLIIGAVCLVAVGTQITAFHRLHFLLARLRPAYQVGNEANRGFRRFGPAAVSAFAATAADFAVVTALVKYAQLPVALSTGLACIVGALINFSLNRWWTFGSKDRPVPQAARYTIVSFTSALLNSGGVALVLILPLGDFRIAWLIVRGMVFLCWNFPLQRDYVYGPRGADKPEGVDAVDEQPVRSGPAHG